MAHDVRLRIPSVIGYTNGVTADNNDSASVILVDENDNEVGVADKLSVHQSPPALHRAFSVFIFDSAGRWLLQKRASTKYHFAGLWTNACCSHPQPGEDTVASARRRLQAEMSINAALAEKLSFIYEATDSNSGLTEWEYDHVFTGVVDIDPSPDPSEVDEWRWVDASDLAVEVDQFSERFTPWFRIAIRKLN